MWWLVSGIFSFIPAFFATGFRPFLYRILAAIGFGFATTIGSQVLLNKLVVLLSQGKTAMSHTLAVVADQAGLSVCLGLLVATIGTKMTLKMYNNVTSQVVWNPPGDLVSKGGGRLF